MSKSSYKKAMSKAARDMKEFEEYARPAKVPATTFIPSKDNPVELVTASFGSPRTVEVEHRRKGKTLGRRDLRGQSW